MKEDSPLDLFIGRAQVITTGVGRGQRVTKAMLSAPVSEQRVLLRTGTFPDPHDWNADFAGLDAALVDHLGERGVRLVGIDTPSVDLQDSKDLPGHAACLRNSIRILEGICLDDAADGVYELIALPLPLRGFDASPVRAILRDIGEAPTP